MTKQTTLGQSASTALAYALGDLTLAATLNGMPIEERYIHIRDIILSTLHSNPLTVSSDLQDFLRLAQQYDEKLLSMLEVLIASAQELYQQQKTTHNEFVWYEKVIECLGMICKECPTPTKQIAVEDEVRKLITSQYPRLKERIIMILIDRWAFSSDGNVSTNCLQIFTTLLVQAGSASWVLRAIGGLTRGAHQIRIARAIVYINSGGTSHNRNAAIGILYNLLDKKPPVEEMVERAQTIMEEDKARKVQADLKTKQPKRVTVDA